MRLHEKLIYHGRSADYIRKALSQHGSNLISNNIVETIKTIYGPVKIISPFLMEDDRQGNRLTISHEVEIQPGKNPKKLEISSFLLTDEFNHKINPERIDPYAIPFPLAFHETIQIKGRFPSALCQTKQQQLRHPSLIFEKTSSIKKDGALITFQLQSLKDHILPDDAKDYWQLAHDIEKEIVLIFDLEKHNLWNPIKGSIGLCSATIRIAGERQLSLLVKNFFN